MRVDVGFPGNDRVQATCGQLKVEIGPPPDEGGDPDAYGPFDMLLCALGTCTGYQVLSFLEQRGLPTDSASLCIEAERSPDDHLLKTVCMKIQLPSGFPEKYNDAIIRATGKCFIKQQFGHKPDFEVQVVPSRV